MVRDAGLEPASLSALGPKPSAFAISPAALVFVEVECMHNIPCLPGKTTRNERSLLIGESNPIPQKKKLMSSGRGEEMGETRHGYSGESSGSPGTSSSRASRTGENGSFHECDRVHGS